MRYMILKLHGNETRSSCDQRLFFSPGASRLIDAASPRTTSIDKKKISSGTQGSGWTFKKLKMKEIGELVGNLLCLDKQAGISEKG